MLRLAAISERALVPAPRSLQWALSFGNEGIALMQRRDAAMAKTVLSQINTASEMLRHGGDVPSVAYYKEHLPWARAVVARLGKARSAR